MNGDPVGVNVDSYPAKGAHDGSPSDGLGVPASTGSLPLSTVLVNDDIRSWLIGMLIVALVGATTWLAVRPQPTVVHTRTLPMPRVRRT